MRISAVIVTSLGLSIAQLAAQPAADKTLTGTVTIKSNDGAVAVHGKSTDKSQGDFLFCLDRDRSGAAQRIDFTGPARVIYRPLPMPVMPEGVVIKGPENVASVLTVVADDGHAGLFVGKGQQAPAAGANSRAITVNVALVRRTDWASGSGPRRGTDIAGCLSPAG